MTRPTVLAFGMQMLAAAGVVAGAAPPARAQAKLPASAVERVWPDPPATARIRFVSALVPRTSRHRSLLRKVWDAVAGGTDAPVMKQPYGLALGPGGRLYVADPQGRAVHVYDLRDGGYSKLDVASESLIGIATLGGRIFLTDSVGGRVMCLSASGKRQWAVGGGESGLLRPTGIVAADDRVYVVDTLGHQVVAIGVDGRVLERFGSRGAEPGQFNYPTSIARDRAGRLYVVDAMNFRVQVFTPQGRFVSAFGRAGDGSGDFSRPKGVALDSDGHVYVVDGLQDVVQIFDTDGRFLLAFGQPGREEGEFWLATGIAIAGDRIYVADSSNGRVQVFDYLKAEP
ncbi:MAG TPA: 6-bladed beta-propeller [Vicinamibacterales bacterium]|nr:6-bladed beta-propeller [Vicinamibacterales bacterium]